MTAELQVNQYHFFFEQPALSCHRDDTGVFTIQLHLLRLSVYGRKFYRS